MVPVRLCQEFPSEEVAVLITVCGKADQVCPEFPVMPGRHHRPFDDPADAEGNEESQMVVFRPVRAEIDQVFTAYGHQIRP